MSLERVWGHHVMVLLALPGLCEADEVAIHGGRDRGDRFHKNASCSFRWDVCGTSLKWCCTLQRSTVSEKRETET